MKPGWVLEGWVVFRIEATVQQKGTCRGWRDKAIFGILPSCLRTRQPAMRQEKRGRDPQSVNLARSNLAIRCIASSGVGGRPNPIGALVRRNNRPRPEKSFWLTNSSPHAPPPSKRPPSPPLVGVHRGTYGENKTEKQNNKT